MPGLFSVRKLGFTGTRHGLSGDQREGLVEYVRKLAPHKAAHGDCVGADAEFHQILREFAPNCEIHIWPSTFDKMRAFCEGDVMYEPGRALERDKYIVKFSNYFVGCPPTDFEVQRSGSWATLRMARNRLNKKLLSEVTVFFPTAGIVKGDWRLAPGYRQFRGE